VIPAVEIDTEKVLEPPGTVMEIPFPTPGSVSIKYSARSTPDSIKNSRGSYNDQSCDALLVLIKSKCLPEVSPAVLIEVENVTVSAGVGTGIGIPFPTPGSVSKKYSATVIFWAYIDIVEIRKHIRMRAGLRIIRVK
jgi:hypothetical protein